MLPVEKTLSKTGLMIIFLLVAIPLFWPLFQKAEGLLMPVVTPASIDSEKIDETGIAQGTTIHLRFTINRQCEFQGVNWYTLDDDRIEVVFPPKSKSLPKSRSVGPQKAGPWLLIGIDKVKGSRAEAVHRCHPLWLTRSKFYGD